jgi:hypothetical protein
VTEITNEALMASSYFLSYDTDDFKYEIPYAGMYVVLLFMKPSGELFTTVRTMWGWRGENKKEFYRNMVDQVFEVVVNEPVSPKI